MKLTDLRDNPGAKKGRMRIGRGIGSGKGKTGGRGGKGQTARSGVRIKGFEGGQMPLHRRLPKRGFNNIFALDFVEITLKRVQTAIDSGRLDAGKTIDAAALVGGGVIKTSRDGVRLIATGTLKSKASFVVSGASAGAKAAVEALGGTVEVIVPKPASGKAGASKASA
jgi:large subunit ribosomal protein L15